MASRPLRREARRARAALAGGALALAAALARAEGAGLVHGDLTAWEGGTPSGWRVEVGASVGDRGLGPPGPVSGLDPVEGGGAVLFGDASTRVWRLLSQSVATRPGDVVRLRFEARGEGLVREPGQFGSAYVGLVAREQGKLSMATLRAETRFRTAFTPCEVLARASGQSLDVAAFLSQTGRLSCRALRLDRLEPEGAFRALVEHLLRTYPFLVERGVDVAAHAATLDERARAAAGDPAAFAEVLADLLAPLRDVHVWIDRPGAPRRIPFAQPVDPGFDARAVAARLQQAEPVGRIALRGRLDDAIGYLAIGALPASGTADADALHAAFLRATEGAQALILDLRPCTGGDETTAQRLVVHLAPGPVVYAKRRFRDGPGPTDFAAPVVGSLTPSGAGDAAPRVPGPVVALLGPGCVSSGEALAAMVRALPAGLTVGLPTRGASGNPAPVPLPHGIDVWLPRWASFLPDGTPLEGRGVAPQVRIEPVAGKDAALDRAIELVRERLAPPR